MALPLWRAAIQQVMGVLQGLCSSAAACEAHHDGDAESGCTLVAPTGASVLLPQLLRVGDPRLRLGRWR